MKMRGLLWLFVGLLCVATPVSAQDYRARVQGQVVDESKGALPGATVTLTNVETGVAVTRVTDGEGRYLVDFVDPGTYALTGELDGFRRAEQTNVRVPQRGDVTVDLTLNVGGLEETVTVEAAPVAVQFNTSSHDITLEKQLLDQVPISGRNPVQPVEPRPVDHGAVGTHDEREPAVSPRVCERLRRGRRHAARQHGAARRGVAGGELQDGVYAGGGCD